MISTTVLENFLFMCLGCTWSFFPVGGGPVPYLELFWVGPVKKTTLYIENVRDRVALGSLAEIFCQHYYYLDDCCHIARWSVDHGWCNGVFAQMTVLRKHFK